MITVEELLNVARAHSDKVLDSIGGRAKFRVRVQGSRPIFFPETSDLPRPATSKRKLQQVIEHFNQTGSLKTTDYEFTQSQNLSYLLKLLEIASRVSKKTSASMSREAFIRSQGAEVRNRQWSWSFPNHRQRFVIFGAWDRYVLSDRELILDESWATDHQGRKKPGYPDAREHIRLVEEEGYDLRTFPMVWAERGGDSRSAKMKSFTPVLAPKYLLRDGTSWYAINWPASHNLAEQVLPETFKEGRIVSVTVNGYERDARAREACLSHYGRQCSVCGMEFASTYGELASTIIDVHHLTPISEIKEEYELDAIRDLRPVCPNCHAVIHRTGRVRSIEEVKAMLKQNSRNSA